MLTSAFNWNKIQAYTGYSFSFFESSTLPRSMQAMERAVLLNALRDAGSVPEPWAKKNGKVASLIR